MREMALFGIIRITLLQVATFEGGKVATFLPGPLAWR